MNFYLPHFLILFIALFWTSGQQTKGSDNEEIQQSEDDVAVNHYCRMNNEAFQDGEQLTYKIFYNVNFIWLNAGTVTFNIRKRGDKYYASAVGKTHGGYDWFFKVRDTFFSVLDANTLLPLESTRIVNEGSYTKYDHVNYLRNSRLAESTMGKTRKEAESTVIDIDQCVHDVLSSLYAMRNTPMRELGSRDRFNIEMMLDRKKYPISLYYKGTEENKKIKGLGNLDVHLFEPTLIAGNIFKEDSKMKIWVSQDQNKIPLLIESPISVGKIKAILSDHQKLRYETKGY